MRAMRAATLVLFATSAIFGELIVAAASDLAPLEPALVKAFGAKVRFSFGSSGALLRQIENGAPFDVFLSANEQFVADGAGKGVLVGPAQNYAQGRIALWSRSGEIRTLDQLRDLRILHIAIANPVHAPYGAAAKQALEKAGLWGAISSKVVFGENIRQALQFAESGNADVAIVAWTLAHNRGGILLPDTIHSPIRQAGAVVTASKQPAEAARFLRFLAGPKGRAVLASGGLEPPRF